MKINSTRVASACVPLLLSISISNALAVPVAGGTLDPLTIPKYVTPLVIPPVMNDTGTPDAKGNVVYDIAVRQFKQQILPGGIWAGLPGCSNTAPNVCTFPATTVWSYGPAADPEPSGGIAPAINSQFNYPAYTIENIKDAHTTVNWINELTTNAWALDPLNKGDALPHLFAVDQSLHWANPIGDCESGEVRSDCAGNSAAPYTGPVPMVTHVHGTHVGSAGDGYTEAWWLPDAENINCVTRLADGSIDPLDLPTGLDTVTGVWSVACEGTIANQLTNAAGFVVENTNNPDKAGQGAAKFGYPNDQPSTTLWYHDHSLGMTRLNVYAGPAGFWLVRDAAGVDGETGLVAGMVLPGPAPVTGDKVLDLNVPGNEIRGGIREIPIVIQGRSFNMIDAAGNPTTDPLLMVGADLFYPDNRAFFEGLNVAGTDANGQFPPGTGELQIDMDPATSDIAPIWNPEAFFNTMVVNGVTWPKLEVAPAQYRFRLLNGSNSRFINLALMITDVAGNNITAPLTFYITAKDGTVTTDVADIKELNFYQIGAEQSLKPTVTAVSTGYATDLSTTEIKNGRVKKTTKQSTKQQALLMGLAERADVIVDFRGLPHGTIITMTNTAPDAPFGGFPDVAADPATTGQVMRFVVNDALLGLSTTDEMRDPVTLAVTNPTTAATNVDDLVVDPAALDNFTVAVTNPIARELALIEEESALICADVDLLGNVVQLVDFTPVNGACVDAAGNIHATALPFAPMAAVTGTVDAAAGTPTVTLWSDPIVTNVNPLNDGNTAEQWNLWNFTVDGHPIHVHLVKFKVLGRSAIGGGASVVDTATGAEAWEDGWKDTVITYPGEITSIAADFDVNGLYVWHCHILEHEDNEMMVPMCVGVAGVDCPAQLF